MSPESTFKTRLVDTAKEQHALLGGLRRGDTLLRECIARYCQEAGVPVPHDVDLYHWSAVFISWCMRTAGASATEFPTATAHWQYVVRAQIGSPAPFLAHRLAGYAPQCGDLLHFNRDGGTISFERARTGGYPAESGIIVAMSLDGDQGKAQFILGNDANGTVELQSARVDPKGRMVQRDVDPFICVIEALK